MRRLPVLSLYATSTSLLVLVACVGADAMSPTLPTNEAGVVDAQMTTPTSDANVDDAGCGECNTSCHRGMCGGAEVVQVAAGGNFACALLRAGTVWCWGANDFGVIKAPPLIDGFPPTEIVGLDDVQSIAAGYHHACAVKKTDGSVWCWGRNDIGQLGHPSGENDDTIGALNSKVNPKPVRVVGVSAKELALGGTHSCALTTTGFVACWGQNDLGQLGIGTISSASPAPVPTKSLTNITAVRAFSWPGNNTCAIDEAKDLWCWGYNSHGELGHEPTKNGDLSCLPNAICNPTPQKVTLNIDGGAPAFDNILDVTPGWATCAVRGGAVYCWGINTAGQQGNGLGGTGEAAYPRPEPVPSLASGVVAVNGGETMCARRDTEVHCWGNAATSIPGAGTDAGCSLMSAGQKTIACQTTPYGIPGLTAQSVVLSGGNDIAAFAITLDKKVVAWGSNAARQAGHEKGAEGDGPAPSYVNPTPKPVVGLP